MGEGEREVTDPAPLSLRRGPGTLWVAAAGEGSERQPAAISRIPDEAIAGATTSILVSTAMARDLYPKLGFTDVMPMVEFRSI
jgi:hypothetical protein